MHYMHYKDYIHHDFYVYPPVLLTQYLGHCGHTPCTELYILRIRCITSLAAEKTPLPCHRGRGNHLAGGGVGVPAHIYIYLYIHARLSKIDCINTNSWEITGICTVCFLLLKENPQYI